MTDTLFNPADFSRARNLAFVAPLLLILPASAPAAAEENFYLGTYRAADPVGSPQPRRARTSQAVPSKGDEKTEKSVAEGRKPQGPLVIAISIQRQQVRVYDSNGLFAEAPISSGMRGHPTPMGVFSVIQKHKYHRSNIYSGAPMPYMQRITWSGVAMHAGVLPGYPASHGCIRMPMSFAMKMWGWTKMGARVVVTPGEVSPADFTHPLLARLVPPQPVAALPDVSMMGRIKTADASGTAGGRSDPQIMVDIATSGIAAAPEISADLAQVSSAATAAANAAPAPVVTAADGAALDGMPPPPVPAPLDLSDVAPIKSADEGALAAQTPADAVEAGSETGVSNGAQAEAAALPVPAASAPEQQSQPKDVSQFGAGPTEAVPVAAPLIKRNLPVAMFVSRKDGKLYVRQDFKPVFDAPVEIADGGKALGTHIFTARKDDGDEKRLQWSVVTLPAVARQASMRDDKPGDRRRLTVAEPVKLDHANAEDALSRITLPPDLMARLGDALPPGSSLVVSDQGIAQGETGEGTDFIVRLR